MELKDRKNEAYKVTIVGMIVNMLLVVLKGFAGFFGRSGAMIADAVHSLSDFATDIVVLVFFKVASKPSDSKHKYGHGKYETLATTIIGIVLFGVGVGILVDSVERIIKVVNGDIIGEPGIVALLAAVASIAAKEGLYWYTFIVGKRINSQAVIANAWHHRSDAFSSVATLIGIAGAIFLGEKWRVLDPIAAGLVSVFILKVAIQITFTGINELLEKALPESVQKEIIGAACEIEGIETPHNLMTRKIGNDYAIELHVNMDRNMSVLEAHKLTEQLEDKLRQIYGKATHISIHVEPK